MTCIELLDELAYLHPRHYRHVYVQKKEGHRLLRQFISLVVLTYLDVVQLLSEVVYRFFTVAEKLKLARNA